MSGLRSEPTVAEAGAEKKTPTLLCLQRLDYLLVGLGSLTTFATGFREFKLTHDPLV